MDKENFNMTTWCQELLSCDRFPTPISTAMLNYVLSEKLDEDIYQMSSYKQLKEMADKAGLEYSELALTALRGLAAVPQEGIILVTLFRYLQAVTGVGLTKTVFVDFFETGMFQTKDMVRLYNSQADETADCICDYDWTSFKQEVN